MISTRLISISTVSIALLYASSVFAQVEFAEHLIMGGFVDAISVSVADVDMDGDVDVLGNSRFGGIAWWANDGNQDFILHMLERELFGGQDELAIDLDGDGDMDILGATWGEPAVAWWENDGDQEFARNTIIQAFYANSVCADDIDNDDDIDVVVAGRNGIVWCENDGDQDFEQHWITENFRRAWDACTVDLEGDGDIDVLAASLEEGKISWWENDGEQNFEERIISENVGTATSVCVCDLDGDGDLDVLGTSRIQEGTIFWWENDGDQEFNEHALIENLDCPWNVCAADIDNDGDLDLIGTLSEVNSVIWWENDGEQNFEQHLISDDFESPLGLFVSDIDGDRFVDVLVACYGPDMIIWWENLSPTFQLIVEPDSIDFGPVAFEIDRITNLRLIHRSENEDADNLSLELQVREGENWLLVEPEHAEIQVGDTLDAEVSVFVPEDEDAGEHEGIIVIIPNGLPARTVEIPVHIFAVEGFGSLSGIVMDAATEEPIPGVAIELEGLAFQTITDEQGHYSFENLPAWLYSVCVEVDGYLPYRSNEFELGAGQDVVLDIALLHALCQPDADSIEVELLPDRIEEIELSIHNEGNGPLRFEVERRFPVIGDAEPWDLRDSINAAEQTGDNRLQGIEFDGDNFHVTGGNNGEGRGLVHVFSHEGEHIGSFDQFSNSSWGMRDLAWDGELLWGSDEEIIYGFTAAGELIHQFEGPLEINRAVTWDDERGQLWVCDVTTDLFGLDREGNLLERIELPEDLHIYGLGTFPEDTSGYTIYAFSKDGDFDTQINRINPETGEWLFVTDIETPEELKAGGMCIAGSWDPMSWVCVGVLQGRLEVLDQIDIWHISTRSLWFDSEPDDGIVQPGGATAINVTINSEGYAPVVELEGELIISHDGRGEAVTIPVTMRVVRDDAVRPSSETSEPPSRFTLTDPYPNPFNDTSVMTYEVPETNRVLINVYDITGRWIAVLTDEIHPPGTYSIAWNSGFIDSGVYIILMESSSFKSATKAVKVK